MTAVDRATANDLLQRAVDDGPVPMQVGAVLRLDGAPSLTEVRAALDGRSVTVPRLRQRLVDAPFGCGRPFWTDDDRFDIGRQVGIAACPSPGGEDALLAMAAELLTRRLPGDRPLWAATLVTGLADGTTALVVVFDHVLADGIGGLAVLANLVDGGPIAIRPATPLPPPSRRQLFADALAARLKALARLPAAVARVDDVVAGMRTARSVHATPCSITQSTGPRRRFVVARVDLAGVVDLAHAHGATVNDVVLAAVGETLAALVRRRGEEAPTTFIVSVPVSARRTTTATELGNRVGARLVEVPAVGPLTTRIEALAQDRQEETPASADESAAVLGPIFRLLVWLRLFHRFVDHQRMIHTVVTNLRGPGERFTFVGAELREVVPLTSVTGNVTVAFAVLSYAGTLVITLVADPDACPEVDAARELLEAQLAALVTAPAVPGSQRPG